MTKDQVKELVKKTYLEGYSHGLIDHGIVNSNDKLQETIAKAEKMHDEHCYGSVLVDVMFAGEAPTSDAA